MNFKTKFVNQSRFSSSFSYLKGLFGLTGRFFSRLYLSIRLMTRFERQLVLGLILIAMILGSVKGYQSYLNRTIPAPAVGGEYREAVIGELKYLNPVLAQSDADKSAAALIFSSLVKFDKNEVYPDAAESWEIKDNGLKYTFFLKKNVLFHDGAKLTAQDVAFTLEAIRATEASSVKSPLLDAWKDVKVNVENDYQITFELEKPYGPFLYNTDFGIIPSHLTSDELSKKFTGSGPFIFVKNTNNKDVTTLSLKRNAEYYGPKANLTKLELKFVADSAKATKLLEEEQVEGAFGTALEVAESNNLSYASAKRFGFLFNIRNSKFADIEVRRKILNGEAMPEEFSMRLVTLNAPRQQAKALELKERFAKQNIKLELIYLNPVQLKDVLDSREFETLLYGFDFGYDRDPYIFWHTSQLDKLNFAGYASKPTDILLEDARMMVDNTARNAKYDEFFVALQNEYVAEFYEPISYNYYVKKKIKGVAEIKGATAESRFLNANQWFVKERRVKTADQQAKSD